MSRIIFKRDLSYLNNQNCFVFLAKTEYYFSIDLKYSIRSISGGWE